MIGEWFSSYINLWLVEIDLCMNIYWWVYLVCVFDLCVSSLWSFKWLWKMKVLIKSFIKVNRKENIIDRYI